MGKFSNLAQKINETFIITFQAFFVISLERTIWKKARRDQFDWVCAAHQEYTPLVQNYPCCC